MPSALIGLGSNLGDRRRWLDRAIELLRSTAGVSAVRPSSWHNTRAVGGPAGQPDFLNGAALVETSLAPEQLLARLRAIEVELARVRHQAWGPRTVDLDLLLFDNFVQRTGELEVPHPRMAFRRFVLEPAAEVGGKMCHPVIGWTVAELLAHLDTAPAYVAISGSSACASEQLARAVAAKSGWNCLENAPHCREIALAGSPSPTLEQTIEFLHEQATLLTRANWPADISGTITPFWIEDLLALGDVLWPGKLDGLWQSIGPSVLSPKLLVIYESNSEQLLPLNDSGRPSERIASTDFFRRLCEARHVRAARPGLGAALWLSSGDSAAAETQLVAAIQAMT